MRRAQNDFGSQPVQNKCLNPRWESVGVSGIVRTNLCTNPGIEAVGGVVTTVRTNYAPNPRMNDVNMGGYGSQTLTAISGIVDNPEGITTAVRVAYNAGNSNPGAFFMTSPDIATQYTFSAWVLNEGPAVENIAIAQSTVASGGSQGVQPGVWTKLTWTHTTHATTAFAMGVRIGVPANTGSFLVTAIMAEKAALSLGGYFDGSSTAIADLTFSWSGTANSSASLMRGTSCPSYVGANNAVTYRTGTPGTALAARTFFTNNTVTDSGIALGLAFNIAQASKTYTLSCDITTSVDRTMKLSIQGAGTVNTNLTFAHTAGVKVRRSITFQTNSSATGPANVALYILRTDALLGTFDVDNILIEEANLPYAYFDGATAATADFTHSWSGTANASISRQSAVAIAYANTTGSGNKITYMCSERPALHSKFIRFVIDTTNSVALNTTDCVVPAGVKRTNLFWLRTSRAMTIQVRYRTTDGAGVSNGPIILTAANEWQMWRISDKPSVADNQHLSLLIASPNSALGDVVDLGPHLVVEGEYAGDYVDGSKALSKWYGTADASESIGYPPQLYDIAGVPNVDVTAPGTYNLDDSFGLEEPRTIYSVYSILQPVLPQTPIMTYGVTGLADTVPYQTMMLRLQMSGVLIGVINRRTSGAGPVQYNASDATIISIWGMNDDGIQFVTKPGSSVATSSQVMAVPHQQISVFNPTAYHKHHRTLIYRGIHDPTTRANVARYLANKYGAYVA